MDRDRPGQTADPDKTDVFKIHNKYLWFPKRYKAESDGYNSVVVRAYGPDLVSRAEHSGSGLESVSIRFSSYMGDKAIKRAGDEAIARVPVAGSEYAPEWLPEAGLFVYRDGARHYYFSETYAAPGSDSFIVVCDSVGYSIRAHLNCRVGYLIYGLVYLEYGFLSSAAQDLAGWKELDLAVRNFALSALWYDGESSSLPPTVGYDDEGRLLRTIGAHTLYFPAVLARRSYASPSIAEFMNIRVCLPAEVDGPVCARVILQADEHQKMPTNDGDEVLARKIRNYQYGPYKLDGTDIEEYRYTEDSSSSLYRMRDLDPNGRYPVTNCYAWCRTYFVVAPGLRALYDFDREHVTRWPQIDAAVRQQISDLLKPPLQERS
ncbi:MAG: hypothetical protein QNJ07_04535 [Woeseiaceae bacterium]|nr:hypothetical protein [Woeseiaceae bacterium]